MEARPFRAELTAARAQLLGIMMIEVRQKRVHWQAKAAREGQPFSKVVEVAEQLGVLEFIDNSGEAIWIMPADVLADFDPNVAYPILRRVVDPRRLH